MATPIYMGYYFDIDPLQPASEILIAELGYAGFESFVETEKGIEAFIQKQEWNEHILDDIYILNSGEFRITYHTQEIKQINWNKEWENNFNPIVIDTSCSVRAPFHEKPDTKYDIVIEPKMSFGTGHHETTHMMIQHLIKKDLKDKKVLDMGSGTGVLAILSEMRGANPIDAIDIDHWCYLNAIENIARNKCKHITVYEGDASLLQGKSYDVVIANINRNILLNDIGVYTKTLKTGGLLFLSGFYKEDLEIITAKCVTNHLELTGNLERNNWIAACYVLK